MSKTKKLLLVHLPPQTITILELLCRKTHRTKEDFTQEAFDLIFQEYKEIILDTLNS